MLCTQFGGSLLTRCLLPGAVEARHLLLPRGRFTHHCAGTDCIVGRPPGCGVQLALLGSRLTLPLRKADKCARAACLTSPVAAAPPPTRQCKSSVGGYSSRAHACASTSTAAVIPRTVQPTNVAQPALPASRRTLTSCIQPLFASCCKRTPLQPRAHY